MKPQEGDIVSTTAIAGMCRATSLTEATGIVSPNYYAKPQDRSFTVRPPFVPFLFDFLGPEPFGFAFTEGQDAKFRVPSRHRFVIEHVNVCCWAKDDHLDVEFVTTWSRTCRNLTSDQSVLQASPCKDPRAQKAEPIWVQGSSLTILLFSNHEVQGSPIVPPDTYVQIWGYLEPTDMRWATKTRRTV